jgi:membrane fusion protein, multidrug efflux system
MASKHAVSFIAVAALAVAGWFGYRSLNPAPASPAPAAVSEAPKSGQPAQGGGGQGGSGASGGQAGPGGPGAGGPGAGGPPPRAFGVEVAEVKQRALKDEFQTVGNLRSRQNVVIKPEIAGRVSALGFSDGQSVDASQMLIQLDDVLQRAEVQQAVAQVSIADANYKRNQELVAQKFVAQRVLDESAASLAVAKAQFALACARLQRMRIVAPFSGVVGIRTVNLGDYVKDGAELVNLEDIHSLYVDFRLPERQTTALAVGQMVEVRVDALPDRVDRARVVAVDPLIDANGRFLTVRALLDNPPGTGGKAVTAIKPAPKVNEAPLGPEFAQCASLTPAQDKPVVRKGLPGTLRPGMFARINVVFSQRNDALVVPESAIVPQGEQQFVILARKPEGTDKLPEGTQFVSKRVPVKLGIRSPGEVEILSGVALGDTVVVAGQQRLQRDGSPMRVVAVGKP